MSLEPWDDTEYEMYWDDADLRYRCFECHEPIDDAVLVERDDWTYHRNCWRKVQRHTAKEAQR